MLKQTWNELMRRLFGGGRRPSKTEYVAAVKAVSRNTRETHQAEKRQTRYTYVEGPMVFLGQQIIKAMQDAGFPSKFAYTHRSAAKQNALYAQGRTAPGPVVTRAKAWQSPHNFWEAVDICHATRGWNVSEEYWKTLRACVRAVAERYGVDLRHGDDWDGDGVPVALDPDESFRDAAHIELRDWRSVRRKVGAREPTKGELWRRFHEVLPEVARRYEADHAGSPSPVVSEAVGSWHREAGY